MTRENFRRWLNGDLDLTEHVMDTGRSPDPDRQAVKAKEAQIQQQILSSHEARQAALQDRKRFYRIYRAAAIICCLLLIGALLFTISFLPRYGQENPQTTEVVRRYVEKGLEETGAVNIVAGLILDYRAFDTLGESHVLFTALICVIILLQIDRKNMRTRYEDYYKVSHERVFNLARDSIMHFVGMILVPCIFLFGAYVLLNGQNGPGGGFSGGAVIGAGLIIFTSSFGFKTTDRFFTAKVSSWITFCALSFYSFAKGYVFFTGANGLENHIPKGSPGAILSGGLILFLDIAVGLVVACTMFGFYSLFRRGSIGGPSPALARQAKSSQTNHQGK